MFGHDHANDQIQQSTVMAEPVADGVLGGSLIDDSPMMHSATPIDTPAATTVTPAAAPMPQSPTPTTDMPATTATTPDDLMGIKQDALQQLRPLVGHLDQTPEEKFRTTMMMIQAADDQGLLSEAYTAAQAIKDDKARAQALLDVVNEINYFTSQQNQT